MDGNPDYARIGEGFISALFARAPGETVNMIKRNLVSRIPDTSSDTELIKGINLCNDLNDYIKREGDKNHLTKMFNEILEKNPESPPMDLDAFIKKISYRIYPSKRSEGRDDCYTPTDKRDVKNHTWFIRKHLSGEELRKFDEECSKSSVYGQVKLNVKKLRELQDGKVINKNEGPQEGVLNRLLIKYEEYIISLNAPVDDNTDSRELITTISDPNYNIEVDFLVKNIENKKIISWFRQYFEESEEKPFISAVEEFDALMLAKYVIVYLSVKKGQWIDDSDALFDLYCAALDITYAKGDPRRTRLLTKFRNKMLRMYDAMQQKHTEEQGELRIEHGAKRRTGKPGLLSRRPDDEKSCLH
jgi:hypothetical protein